MFRSMNVKVPKQATIHHIVAVLVSVLLLSFLALGSVPVHAQAHAQAYTENEVKAALLVQIIKNLQWHDEERQADINVAVWDNPNLTRDFALLNEVSVRNKPIRVFPATVISELTRANVVYIPQAQLDALSNIVFELRGNGTLVVTEQSPTLHNVMINIVQQPQESSAVKLKFQINRPNIAFEGITVLPELVLFGGSEIDVAELYHQTEQAIKNLQQENQANFSKLAEQQKAFEIRENEYQKLLRQMQNLEQELASKQGDLQDTEAKLTTLVTQIGNVETQYQTALDQVAAKEAELARAETVKREFEANVNAQRQLLEQLGNEIQSNQALLSEQENLLNEAQSEVKSQSEVIDKQRDIIYVVLVVVVITLISIVTISYLFYKNKRTKDKLETAITSLTVAKEQLVETEKMASLGQLVTGVAHEINTPIGISLTAISTLGAESQEFKRLIEDGKLRKSDAIKFADKLSQLDELIEGNLARCHRLVENFKQVSADQIVEQSRVIKLNDYCQSIMNTLSAYLKKHHVEWDIIGDNPQHNIDPGLLSQVINNFTTNAVAHAFEDGQTRRISLQISEHNGKSTLIFEDNGRGMNEEVKQRIFDPFYTTRRGKGGIGLGLNIVHTIITTKLNGHITVDSEVDKGTRFTIELPAS